MIYGDNSAGLIVDNIKLDWWSNGLWSNHTNNIDILKLYGVNNATLNNLDIQKSSTQWIYLRTSNYVKINNISSYNNDDRW
jgi:hypothetical protein